MAERAMRANLGRRRGAFSGEVVVKVVWVWASDAVRMTPT